MRNLVCNCGVVYLLLEADRRPVRAAVLLDVRMTSLRHAGHLPLCTVYSIHDHAESKVDTTTDPQPVQRHQARRDVVANVQLMNETCCGTLVSLSLIHI